MGDLPKDTLYDIFSRIPTKSLVRFRCVCKQWREYINDPNLVNIHHVKEEPKPIHIAPIMSSKYSEFQPVVAVLSFLHVVMEDTPAGIMQVKRDLSSKFLLKSFSRSCYCNGLIAMVQEDHADDIGYTFVVINPLTKECHELPLMMKFPRIGRGLGFDHSTNTFKMVCVLYDAKQNITLTLVYVLGTDSWREIPQLPLYRILGEAVYANGRLYWFACTSGWRIGSHLVWLDLKTEEFGVINLPAKQTELWQDHNLVDLNGEIGCVYHIEGSANIGVWMLKHEEWKIHCVSGEASLRQVGGGI